jgi:hypothetical protein
MAVTWHDEWIELGVMEALRDLALEAYDRFVGSPAINAIPQTKNGCGTKITTDERGVKRPQDEGCEIGAFEKGQ